MMKPYVIFECPSCQKQQRFFCKKEKERIHCQECFYCQDIEKKSIFQRCPFCSCKAFFIQKNIHPFFMFLGLFIGIYFVPATYGLSLAILWILDLLLLQVVSDVLVCYQCQSAFSGFDYPRHIKSFQHHIGERYDKKISIKTDKHG